MNLPKKTNPKIKPKLRPLATNERVLVWLYLCPSNDPNQTSRDELNYIAVNLSIVTIIVVSMISSIVHFRQNLSIDLEKALCSLLQIVGNLSALYTVVIAVTLRQKTFDIIQHLSQIYDASKKTAQSIHLDILGLS